jgi:Mn2+/Fe2+ NRAMP family transporter
VNPVRLLVFVAIINGIAAAPFLVVVMLVADDAALLGPYANGRVSRILGWATVVLMAAAAIGVFASA